MTTESALTEDSVCVVWGSVCTERAAGDVWLCGAGEGRGSKLDSCPGCRMSQDEVKTEFSCPGHSIQEDSGVEELGAYSWVCVLRELTELVRGAQWGDASGQQELSPAEFASMEFCEGASPSKPARASQSSLEGN